jgi:hypothetical protein
MAAGALITRGIGLRAAGGATAERSQEASRLLLEVMTASEKITEDLSALVNGLEGLTRDRRRPE